MILLENLLLSYEYLITALETMSIKELTIEYMMKRLMYERSKKKKKKKPKGDDITMVFYQGMWGNPSSCKKIKTCYYCGKLAHVTCFCYNVKKKL